MAELRWGVLPRDVLRVTGPESGSYLQGQLSQDVTALALGSTAWSWLLAPNGKVDALLRVTRFSEAEWLLDTDAGWGEPVMARLTRFKLRSRVEIGPAQVNVLAVRGEGWAASAGRLSGLVIAPPWPGVDGADVLAEGRDAGFPGDASLAADDFEVERILAGIPKMGSELDERTIPAETGLVSLTVSFTKGCYTGQELVARVDSRGSNVPRRLRGLRFRPDPLVAPGSELVDADGRPAGTVTSAAISKLHGGVGLGYVRRGVDPTQVLAVASTAGGPEVTVEQLELRV